MWHCPGNPWRGIEIQSQSGALVEGVWCQVGVIWARSTDLDSGSNPPKAEENVAHVFLSTRREFATSTLNFSSPRASVSNATVRRLGMGLRSTLISRSARGRV